MLHTKSQGHQPSGYGEDFLADIKVVCTLVKWEIISETVTRATENGEEIYTDIVVRKKQSY